MPTFGPNGFVAPSEADILTGAIADNNAAFGGNLNPSLTTPQGQLAQSLTAIIGNCNDQYLALANGVDPAYATGRMQDAIGRIYFMTRKPAQATSVVAVCTGLAGTVIPAGTVAIDTAGNLYNAVTGGTIPVSGSISLEFQGAVTGPISCSANSLNAIYKAIPGWDSVNNPTAGALGDNVETRAAFEARRAASVALNSKSTNAAICAAVYQVPNVLCAYVQDNSTSSPIAVGAQATCTGSIAGTVLTVASLVAGASAIQVGAAVVGPNIPFGVHITSLGSGSGGTGTYNISSSLSIASETISLGGVSIAPNSLYVAAVGGDPTAIATAIWSKKNLGCGYTGNTTITVYDASFPYVSPGIPYSVTFQIPNNISIFFAVSIKNSPAVPSNAPALIQAAILNSFIGDDGGPSAQIGGNILASRFYGGVTNLGPWAVSGLLNLTMGASSQIPSCVFTGSIAPTGVLTVTGISSGSLVTNEVISGTGVAAGTTILSQLTGSAGGAGTYMVSVPQTVSSESMNSFSVLATSVQALINQMPTTAAAYINVIIT